MRYIVDLSNSNVYISESPILLATEATSHFEQFRSEVSGTIVIYTKRGYVGKESKFVEEWIAFALKQAEVGPTVHVPGDGGSWMRRSY